MERKSISIGMALMTFCIMDGAYAVAPGFYMGFQAGPATNNAGPQNVQVLPLPTQANPIANRSTANPKSQQFASRIYLGYKFNIIAGWEFGFTYFSGVNYILRNSNVQPAGSTTFRVRSLDLLGKLDYAFQNTFGVFGKLGVGAFYETTPGGLNVTNWHTITTLDRARNTRSTRVVNSGSNTYRTKLAPVFAFGISYDLNQNWVADLAWTNYQTGGVVSSMTVYALGLSYHFVDRFCGQFLCDD